MHSSFADEIKYQEDYYFLKFTQVEIQVCKTPQPVLSTF